MPTRLARWVTPATRNTATKPRDRRHRFLAAGARNSKRRGLEVLALEPRQLLCADGDHDLDLPDHELIGTFPAIDLSAPQGAGATSTSGTTAAASSALSSIPALNSLAGATATLYLNFLGDYVSSWGSYSNINTPVYDQDGDPSSFSDGELSSITNIWKLVAEDYAPFRINVTTVAPSSYANGVAERVDIGGNGAWTGGTYGGISYVNSFTNSITNVAFVFPDNLGNGYYKYTADGASHEAGHAFGLQHQSRYSGTTKTSEYASGPGDGTAPIMGNSYTTPRSLWWYGTSTSSTTYQDDLAVIAGGTNGFGYRPDDIGGTAATATPLAVSGGQVSGSGLIEKTSDLDFFAFTTGAGTVTLSASVGSGVNNLAPRTLLYDATGSTLIASAGPDSGFNSTIQVDLSAGSYRFVVASNGGYGNVGQYTVGGMIVTSTDGVNAPTSLVATPISTSQVNLSWTDNASNETGYQVDRTTDGVNWSPIATGLPADSTGYADTTAAAGTTYLYRVFASNASLTSDPSNQATATTVPEAPSGLAATAIAANRVDLSWGGVFGATGYRIERSLDGVTWALVATTGTVATSYSDTTVSGGLTYQYRVQATDAGGASSFSNIADATTPAAQRPPAAPTNLVATASTSTQVNLSWTDNASNESGYRIERSTNGGKSWSQIAQVGAGVTSYTDTSANPRKSNSYRVYAFNDAGSSALSNTATISTSSKGSHGPSSGVAFGSFLVHAQAGSTTGNVGPGLDVSSGIASSLELIDRALAEWSPMGAVSGLTRKRTG